MTHLVNHVLENHHLQSDSTLHVVGVVSNPARWNSRYRIAREWIKAMEETKNVKLYVAETAYGDRFHEIVETGNPNHLPLRSRSEVWLKEAMINLGVRDLLPRNWKYVSWIDMDVFFRDPNWAIETIHHLQHFHVVQPWSQCVDLGPVGNILSTFNSMGYLQQAGIKIQQNPSEPYPYGHSGFAWAATREFWEQSGGLMSFPLLGSSDHHMAWSFLGDVDSTIHGGISESFFRRCREWQSKVLRLTNKQIGYVPGRIEHQWHGNKKKRFYRERWQILVDHNFDPDTDIMIDAQGLPTLINKPELEHAIHKYNLSRLEDGIDE